jgi:glycosyltransferase involved in cell wall biosynthesis
LPSLAAELGPAFEILCVAGLRKSFNTSMWPTNMRVVERTDAKHMPDIYRGADAALVPTRYEAFGYVAVEAMACGLPVVGFDSTGTAEVCVDGQTALLAPMDDTKRLLAHVRRLAADASLAEQMGRAGRKRAVEMFGEARAMASYESLYLQLLKGNRGDG